MKNQVIQGDCLIKLKELEDNSVDSIVTDPPYHLVSIVKRFGGENARNTPSMNTKEGGVFARKAKGFMGKEWDGVDENGMGIAMNVDMWAECLRVLKPGGHLLAFSGTRTYHRMASAIEDAGFEVRDMIEWVYGCLSEDTEILTANGWKMLYSIFEGDYVFACDYINDMKLQLEPVKQKFIYDYDEDAYHIKDTGYYNSELMETDHIVSKNHNVLVSESWAMDCFSNGVYPQKVAAEVLYKNVQKRKELGYKSDFHIPGLNGFIPCTIEKIPYKGKVWCVEVESGAFVARRNGKIFITGNSGFPKSLNISLAIDKQKGLQGQRGIGGFNTGGIQEQNNRKAKLYIGSATDGSKQPAYSDAKSEEAKQWSGWGTAMKPSHEPICMARKPLSEKSVAENCLKWGTGGINIDESRVDTITEADKNNFHQNRKVVKEYKADDTLYELGMKTVSTAENPQGRFPANLCWSCDCDNNYLTGNALFDILSNISNQIKLCQLNNSNSNALNVEQKKHQQDTTSEEKKLCFAVENVDTLFLEKILGKTLEVIFSVDTECSVEMLEESMNTSLSISLSGNEKMEEYQKVLKYITLTAIKLITELKTCNLSQSQIIGSFITKVISGIQEQSQVKSHSQDCWVRECFPESKSTQNKSSDNRQNYGNSMFIDGVHNPENSYTDSGNASRFFKSIIYQAKSSKRDRNSNGTVVNTHPTVKSVALMEYLIKMVTPKGGIVLDPFAGSGSTLVAAKQNGFQYIGIEMTGEYIPIIESRLKNLI